MSTQGFMMPEKKTQVPENTKKSPSVVRSAMAMSMGTLGSRVLGLVRDQVVVHLLSRGVMDSFVVAFRLPNLFRRLLGEGSLSVSFIPIFIDVKTQDGEEAAKRLYFAMNTFLLVLSSVLCVLGILFMEPLMGTLVGGPAFAKVAGKLENTVHLARWMFAYLFLVTNYAFGMAVLNSFKKFFLPALAPALFNLSIIVFAFVPQTPLDLPGKTLAWGVLVGGLVQVLMVYVPLYRMGYFPRLRNPFGHPKVKLILRNMMPGLLGMGVLQLMSMANVYFASHLQEGSHSYIYLADRILELPQSLIAISLGAALLPTLSEYWSLGQRDKMIESVHSHLGFLLFLALPSAVGMYILARPIVDVLFVHGEFSPDDAVQTAMVIQTYSFLLMASSFNKALIPSFYAMKNTWLPAVVSVASLTVHLITAPILLKQFGLQGLVATTVISGFVNVSINSACFHRMVGRLQVLRLAGMVLRLIPALVALGISAHYLNYALVDHHLGGGRMDQLTPAAVKSLKGLALIISILIPSVLYFIVCTITGVGEMKKLSAMIKRRLGR